MPRRPSSSKPRNAAAPTRDLPALLDYWKQLHPTSAASTLTEMRHAVRMFERQCRKPVPEIHRADIVAFRDALIEIPFAFLLILRRKVPAG